MGLLQDADWTDRIFTGDWEPGTGGPPRHAIEPATGAVLAEVGQASAQDALNAARRAGQAQRDWAATPVFERAAVLSRAAALFERHAAEIGDWIVRESGSTKFKAGIETGAATAECTEAAALASAPHGELLHSPMPRLSVQRRVPAGVVSVISPFNFPLILSIRSVAPALALGTRYCSNPTRAPPSAAESRSPGSSKRPDCRRECCNCCRAASRSAAR